MIYLIRKILPIILLAFIANSLSAGNIDLKAKICEYGEDFIYIDVYVKESNANEAVDLADQNYRFSFNPDAVQNPFIVNEGDISGVFSNNGAVGYYFPHTMTSNPSFPGIGSYNIALSGSSVGYPLSFADWSHVGTLGFEIIDPSENLNFVWHDDVFPPTYASEVTNTGLELLNIDFEVEYCPEFCEMSYEILCVNENINGVNYVYDFQVTTSSPDLITMEGFPIQFFIDLPLDNVWRDLGNGVYGFYMIDIALNNIQLTNCIGKGIPVAWPICPTWGEGKDALNLDSKKKEFSLFNLEVNGPDIYPNPATDFLILESSIDTEIEILSLDGKSMRKASLTANTKEQLDISSLQSGVYFVRDLTTNHIEKIVVE